MIKIKMIKLMKIVRHRTVRCTSTLERLALAGKNDIDKHNKDSMASKDHEDNDNALFVLHIGTVDPGRCVASHRVNRRGAGDG